MSDYPVEPKRRAGWLKLLVYSAAAGGFVAWARQSHLLRQFRHARDIPSVYITRQLRVKGTVASVGPTGILRIRHEPVIPVEEWLKLNNRPDASPALLNVRVGGVQIGEAGIRFLDSSLVGDRVWCQLIRRADDTSIVDANITAKRPGTKRPILYNLNRDLVTRGYARAVDATDQEYKKAVQTIPAYARLVNQLQLSSRGDRSEMSSEASESLVSLPVQMKQMVLNSALYQISLLAAWGLYTTWRVAYSMSRSAAEKTPQGRKFIAKVTKMSNDFLAKLPKLSKTQKKRWL